MTRMMKAAVWQAPSKVTVEMVPIEEVGPKDVLIKVVASGICGSDMHSYKLGFYTQPGQILGHEFAGTIAEVGSEVEGIEVGDAVTGFHAGVCGTCYWCQRGDFMLCPDLFKKSTGYGKPGSFAEYVHIPNAALGASVVKLPEGMEFEVGATIEPVATAVAAISEVRAGDRVVVLGAGLIGNAVMQGAKNHAGAEKVIVSEVSPLRLEAARKMGADAVFDARQGDALEWVKKEIGVGLYHFHEGGMADVVVEAAGAPQTVAASLEMVRSKGTIVFLGLPEKPALIDVTKIAHKQPKIVGVLGGSMEVSIHLLASGKVDTRPLITHRYSLDDAPAAFDMSLRADEAIKVMILP